MIVSSDMWPEDDSQLTWVVFPSNLAKILANETCGMIFFSLASWNKGVAGRSSARKRKGD
jgi:hypothetical protein